MHEIASTPAPPYYAVIFTTILKSSDPAYEETAEQMLKLAKQQDGYLGFESARDELGISVSYWRDLDSIKAWKNQLDHQQAQIKGRQDWYQSYQVRIARVEKDYGMQP